MAPPLNLAPPHQCRHLPLSSSFELSCTDIAVHKAKTNTEYADMCTANNSKAAACYNFYVVAMDFKLAVNNNCVSWGLNRKPRTRFSIEDEVFYQI